MHCAASRHRWTTASLAGLLLALGATTSAGACDNGGDPELVSALPDDDATIGGNGGSPPDGRPDDASDSGSGGETATDALVAPVRVGIVPLPASVDDAGASLADQTAAHLDVLAAGARATSLVYRWDELADASGSPRADVFEALASWAALHREARRSLLLSIALVDRTLDARPATLVSAAWDAATVESAARRIVDEAFAHLGSELVFLSFGNEVDRFLVQASTTERGAFVRLTSRLCEYVRSNTARPEALRVGVSLSVEALASAGTERDALVAASDVVIGSYFPREGLRARLPSAAATELGALVSAQSNDAGDSKPIVLQEVGYPSATAAGSSPEQQRSFFDALFQTLAARRDAFPFVSVYALHDLGGEACAAEARAYGMPADANAEAFFCSMGVRETTGQAKPAWQAVVGALATFHDP